jgi:hypothetical protein
MIVFADRYAASQSYMAVQARTTADSGVRSNDTKRADAHFGIDFRASVNCGIPQIAVRHIL